MFSVFFENDKYSQRDLSGLNHSWPSGNTLLQLLDKQEVTWRSEPNRSYKRNCFLPFNVKLREQ